MSDDLAEHAEAVLARWRKAPGYRITPPPIGLVADLVAELKTTRAQLRQVGRQLGLFLEDGERNRVIVALAITDGATKGTENA